MRVILWRASAKSENPPSTFDAMTTTSTGLTLTRVLLDIEGAVARIALRNPPLNVIDIPMMEELAQVVSEIESQSEVAVIILRGAGQGIFRGRGYRRPHTRQG